MTIDDSGGLTTGSDQPGDPSYPSTDPVRAEIEALLQADATRLGDVYRLDRRGMNANEIAEALELSTSGFVSNYRTTVAALLDNDIPQSPTLAAQTSSRVRSWLKKPGLSTALRTRLDELQAQLQLRADDQAARSVEDTHALQRTDEVERAATPGIYVYTLPHYIRYPYDPDSGRTLLKVGRSERDAYQRSHSQGRITALPEDPVLLRVYEVTTGDTSAVEHDFHSWLNDADHERSRSLRGGSEWFLTSTKFLDRVARAKGLPITVVSDLSAGDL